MPLRFAWDARKAAANLRKHGVSFAEAGTAFEDPLSITVADPDHSARDERFILMKKASKTAKQARVREAMRDEYEFSGGIRGKYAARFAEGTNLVLLAPDVAAVFPNATAVNKALRQVIKSRTKRRPA